MELSSPLSQITPLGQIIAKRLKKMGLNTCQDLFYHFPFRYDDFSQILTIAELKKRGVGTIKVRINQIVNRKTLKRKLILTEALVSDLTGSLKIVWFGQPFLIKVLRPNQEFFLAGKIDTDEFFRPQMVSPSYEKVKKETPLHTGRLVPVYSTTEKLSQKQLRFLIKKIIPLTAKIKDWLPDLIRSQYQLMFLPLALEQIHFPASQNLLAKAQHRLKFDELFLIQCQTQLIKEKLRKQLGPKIEIKTEEIKKFVKKIPFTLTSAQKRTAWEILKDLNKPRPMNRLLEGDVGSGKTMVATIAILNVILNNYQVAYLAPTEILAQQHFENISKLLKDWLIKIALLTREEQGVKTRGKKQKIKKEEVLEKIRQGKINLVIGTHALLQEKVKFAKLALIIVDEQHRFGVEQRAALTSQNNLDITQTSMDNTLNNTEKTQSDENLGKKNVEIKRIIHSPTTRNETDRRQINTEDPRQPASSQYQSVYLPHFLSMTATPIPRSLALTLYGDLDLSIIDEMPPGRKKVEVKIVKPKEENQIYNFIRKEIKNGRQAFVICPLIDPSDKLGVKSVKQEYEKLDKKVFPDLKLAMLHGKLSAQEKEKIMKNFLKNKIKILISTTVVEVGIDVPNASIMLIEGAERFGLAQLWQLKGRVGRAEHQSYCFLLSENYSEKTKTRLKALLTAQNGFELAEKDLAMRGPGEIFGREQSGYLKTLKIAKLSDWSIIKEARAAAIKILSLDSELKKFPLLKEKMKEITKITHLE